MSVKTHFMRLNKRLALYIGGYYDLNENYLMSPDRGCIMGSPKQAFLSVSFLSLVVDSRLLIVKPTLLVFELTKYALCLL